MFNKILLLDTKRLCRLAIGAIFFLYGLCSASWGQRVATFQQTLHLTDASLGSILMAAPIASLCSLPVAGWLIARKGSRIITIFAGISYIFVLLFLGMAHTSYQLVGFLMLFGFSGNILNIAVNSQAVEIEALYERPIMASFHALWSIAAFTGALIGTLMLSLDVAPYGHFLLICIIAIIIIFFSYPYLLRTAPSEAQEKEPLFVMPTLPLLQLGLIALSVMICEGAMGDWSGVYLKKVVGSSPAMMGWGLSAFTCTMAGGRFISDRMVVRWGAKRVLQVSGWLIFSGLLLAVLIPGFVTAIVGFLLVGAGTASVVPLVYSIAGRTKGMSPGMALAAVSTVGFLGFLFGPPMIGLVAGLTSLRISFFIISLLGLSVTWLAGKIKL